jgi:hypothetical protein
MEQQCSMQHAMTMIYYVAANQFIAQDLFCQNIFFFSEQKNITLIWMKDKL